MTFKLLTPMMKIINPQAYGFFKDIACGKSSLKGFNLIHYSKPAKAEKKILLIRKLGLD